MAFCLCILGLPKIWRTLIAILRDSKAKENLEGMKEIGVPDFQYNFKTSDVFHSGPYGMLVRESAFHADAIGNHDYLRMPEIIEDICNGYYATYGQSIYEEVSRGLVPCIVKFESDKHAGTGLIAPALLYCWGHIKCQEFHLFANTDFDAAGAVIPREAIQRIEFVHLIQRVS